MTGSLVLAVLAGAVIPMAVYAYLMTPRAVGLMHTLFTLEDNYGLKISEMDGEVCLKVDVRKNKDAARLHEMLCSWQQAAAMLEAGEISKEDYDKWRYHYPEFGKTQNYVKMQPQDLV